jgi:transposase
MSKRQQFSPELKREAVGLVRCTGSSCRQVAPEIGINPNMLTRWVRESASGASKVFSGTGSPRDEELSRLKRELAKVTKERDFLETRQRTSPRDHQAVRSDPALLQ